MSKKIIQKNLDRPERPDHIYVGSLLKELFSSRISIIALLIVCLALCGIIMSLINRPLPIAVVNGQTGQTMMSKTDRINKDIIERQLLFYSREFCEQFFGRNHVTIRDYKVQSFKFMHPNLITEASKSFSENTVNQVLQELWIDNFVWKITVVTEKSDPRYTVFCQFDQTIKRPGFEPVTNIHNIKLDWGRLVKNSDPFEKPHSLVLLKVYELSGDELKKQLNLSY